MLKGNVWEKKTNVQLGEGHVNERVNSQDCEIQDNNLDQPRQASIAKIESSHIDQHYHEKFNKYIHYHWIGTYNPKSSKELK